MTRRIPPSIPRAIIVALGVGLVSTGIIHNADAEPTFLSKQYTRCSTCHYSDTGGGLLTPYGRSLSREAISMLGASDLEEAETATGAAREEDFLGGILDDIFNPVQLGLDLRPSHLEFASDGRSTTSRNFFMNLDLIAAYQDEKWTLYGEVGRQPSASTSPLGSYEHWVGYRLTGSLQLRAGRFAPAYGIRFADHTALPRRLLGLTQYDQLYGVELGISTDRTLLQIALSPGLADSIVDNDGRQAFTTSGRIQVDLNSRSVVVGSVLYRQASDIAPQSIDVGVAVGLAPTPRVTTWTQVDLRTQDQPYSDRAYIVAHQTSLEVIRGLWVRVSPQLHWTDRNSQSEIRRLVLGADVYPRTHWHVNLSYYRDRTPFFSSSSRTFLAQLHLYL